jgi:hypothetical protein
MRSATAQGKAAEKPEETSKTEKDIKISKMFFMEHLSRLVRPKLRVSIFYQRNPKIMK